MRPTRPDPETLQQWYITENKTCTEIARLCKTSHRSVLNWLHRYGIPVRSYSEAQTFRKGFTDDDVRALYEQGCSQEQVAQHFDITQSAVKARLKKMGIKARSKANNGAKNGMYGRTHSDEAREKIREANRVQFASEEARYNHARLTTKQIGQGRTGKAYNKLEKRFAQMLDDAGIAYQQQFRLTRYSYDFYLPTKNALIEVHGDFWHANPRFYRDSELSAIQQRNIENDQHKARCAMKHGYRYDFVWEYDIYANPHRTIEEIKNM